MPEEKRRRLVLAARRNRLAEQFKALEFYHDENRVKPWMAQQLGGLRADVRHCGAFMPSHGQTTIFPLETGIRQTLAHLADLERELQQVEPNGMTQEQARTRLALAKAPLERVLHLLEGCQAYAEEVEARQQDDLERADAKMAEARAHFIGSGFPEAALKELTTLIRRHVPENLRITRSFRAPENFQV
ncbi:MAG: hypothetical protein J4203_06060 [Candidatus Diapherotrites archaeon]|uniref:Uncharacterized protein n=1 Tax=Candidatus Iainarchaeum sp. TaxID=3101447 RepID=A0A8T4LCR5_9ARCH|nr:hypothetical protein [Candidatus Diapherotrites archaeon]